MSKALSWQSPHGASSEFRHYLIANLLDEVRFSAYMNPLLFQMTKREVVGRYQGSVIGLAWSFLNPLMMLAIYTFVFGVVFSARWQNNGGHADFAMNLFAGLIVFNIFSECINRAPMLVLSNVSYVKKVVFPLYILPITVMLSALFHALVSLVILFLFYAFVHGLPHWTVVFLPLVWIPLALLTLGFSWFLASLGVYLRDIGQVVGVATTALLFLSPVFFPASALPESVRQWAFLNPLTLPIEQTREIVIHGNLPAWNLLAIYAVVSICITWLGFIWFDKTRKGFADVI